VSLFCGLKLASKYCKQHPCSSLWKLPMDMAYVSNTEFDRALKFSLTERGTPELKLKTKQLKALRVAVQSQTSGWYLLCFCQMLHIHLTAPYL